MNENHKYKKIELKKIIPSWYQLSFCSRSPIFKSSIAIMFIIPIWARIASINPQETNSFTHYLIGFLDNNIPLIPKNLLRIFWASFSINVAYIIYAVLCPKKIQYQNFQHWLDKDEDAIHNYIIQKNRKGSNAEEEIINDLKDQYKKEVDQSNYTLTPLRFLISIFYIFSSILLLYTIVYQITPVWSITNFNQLIWPN